MTAHRYLPFCMRPTLSTGNSATKVSFHHASPSTEMSTVTDLVGYVLETLRLGSEYVLYRGRYACGGAAPILVLGPAAAQQSPANLGRLEHEYALASQLDPEWAVQPIALARRDGHTMLVFEDPGGEPLDRLLDGPLKISEFLRIAIALAGALRGVHERGLIHKDIKPASVLVDVANGGVWLTGFGIASRLPRERQDPEPPEEIAGTLAYMAPEQTGRMNRSIDSRSDLYALGITFYEMLTGTPPFRATDPMEWIHCHIARQPVSPCERVIAVPAQLSAIVMKLLAKIADERYQTAAGVAADLRGCLAAWEAFGRIDSFPLATQDASDRLMIPERLYGREREIDALLAAFDRVVAQGAPELVLVSGYPGVGKSSVANELHKVLVSPRSLFATGKFDQYKRDIPYTTLAQAFQILVHQILVKSEAEMDPWRSALAEAVGPNGELIVSLIPELELIIGKQPPVSDLPPKDAKNRFQMVFRRFLSVFAREEHPLALFLDDLQWLDTATLDLLEHLVTHAEVRHLLLVLAYRDNEVGAAHPLVRTIEAIRKAGARVQEIVLAPLGLDNVGRLIADGLHCEPQRARPLAQLVHDKTGGNPFFTIQFFTALADEGLLTFDSVATAWTWDIDRIRGKNYTDNVVDLMAGKLTRFSTTTQEALRQLACLGNVAEISTLSLVHGETEEAMHAALWEAVHAGLVVHQGNAYRFLHDRIQQAAYSLIPEEQRAEVHLSIGRALLASMTADGLAEHLFDVANQLNRGAALLIDRDEKAQVATIDLRAGRKAMASAAHASARAYFSVGMALLDEKDWASNYDLTFSLWLERAECEFLSGNFENAERLIVALLQRAASTVDQAAVYHLKVLFHVMKSENQQAVASALTCLRLFGIDLPAHPTWEQVQAEYETVWQSLNGRPIESLIDLPLMTDPDMQAAMRVLSALTPAAYFTDFRLSCLQLCRVVQISMQYGTSGGSAQAYASWGVVLGQVFHRYRDAHRFAKLACELVEKHGFIAYHAKIDYAMGTVAFWTQPIATAIDFMRATFRAAIETGELTLACFGMLQSVTGLLLRNDPLDAVWRESEMALGFAREAKYGDAADMIGSQQRFIATMQGRTATLSTFSDAQFDEATFEAQLTGDRMPLIICWYWILKLKARFLSGDYAEALAAADKVKPLLSAAASQIQLLDYFYYAALTVTACYKNASAEQQQAWRDLLIVHREQLREWAENYPPTFADKHALVLAEIARLEGRDPDVMRLYEQAIQSARENGFVQNEGLAHEVAARFYAVQGFETISNAYLQNARSCYLRWGADGKVRQMDLKYPHLVPQLAPPGSDSTIGTPVVQLDLATVVKVSQAISGEIDFNKLIAILMETALEHAGGERGLLILPRGEEMWIEAEATTAQDTIVVCRPNTRVAPAAVPESVLCYVIRTRNSVLLNDASKQDPFSGDEYVRRNNSRSILCLPLIKQADLIGVLYLENCLASHVFTPARIAVLRLLASQAATSLENARLYSDLRDADAYLAEAQRLSHTGSFGWNPSSGEIYWSEETFRIFECGRATTPTTEFIMRERVHPEDVASFRQIIERAAKDGQDYAHEFRLRMPDGRVKHIHVVAHGMRNETTDVGFVGAVMDVTAIRLAEMELHKTRTELAHVARMTSLGELTASIAHEVNQPLGAVVTNADAGLSWLDRHPPNMQEAHAALERIVRDGNRASEVIRRVRTLAKKTDIQMARLELNEVVSEALALVQHELLSYRVSMRMDLATALPLILADRVQLQQVILNLVLNGIEAMQSITDRARELVIRSEQHDAQHVRVTVTDCGVGFSAEHAERLFNSFFTTKSSGMGMGLSICRSIIDAHGGCIWATSNLPHGAIIQFTLPSHPEVAP
jgi:predicted ATPase/signal transduction histidine kinase